MGYTQSEAENALTEAGFEVDTRFEYSDEVGEGYVIRQSSTGKEDKGSTIVLTVSSGPATTEVPNVGYTQSMQRTHLVIWLYGQCRNPSTRAWKKVLCFAGPDGGDTATMVVPVTITVSTGLTNRQSHRPRRREPDT